MVSNTLRKNVKNLKEQKNMANHVNKIIKNVEKMMSNRKLLIEELNKQEKEIKREFDNQLNSISNFKLPHKFHIRKRIELDKKVKKAGQLKNDLELLVKKSIRLLELQKESTKQLVKLKNIKVEINKKMNEPVQNFILKYIRNTNRNGNRR